MDEPLRQLRCECCDEVLDELLSMRQNFEKLFQRFNNQIVQMRRELSSLMANKQKAVQSNNQSYMETNETENISNVDCVASTSGVRRKSRSSSTKSENNIKQEPNMSPRSNVSLNSNLSNPIINFLGIKRCVMPTCPFKSDDEFEVWEHILEINSEQRDRLREELLQGELDDPDKFVMHIWRSVLADEVAQCYTYRGNAKSDKKSIQNYNFTTIFKESFIQRYADQDAFFFMEQTVRFFNSANDRLRSLSEGEKQFENFQLTANNLEDQSVDELIKVLNEEEDVFIEDIKYPDLAPDDETYKGHNITVQRNHNRPITMNDFYNLRQDFNELKKTITKEIKQQNENIYDVIAEVIQDKTIIKKLKPNIEQHKSLMQDKKRDAKSILPNNPYKNIKDFKVFEKSIDGDRAKFDELVLQFLQIAANSSTKFIKLCWRKLLTDEAAQHLCWKGTDKKDSIRILRVTAALKVAYDEKYVEHTDMEFERTCMMFFQYAKSRYEKKQAYHVYHSLGKH